MTKPTPRTQMRASIIGDTWLETEEYAYPNGGFTRRALVRFEDGKLRVVLCSIPDTYFSIPARARIHGRTVKGYITSGDANRTQEITT